MSPPLDRRQLLAGGLSALGGAALAGCGERGSERAAVAATPARLPLDDPGGNLVLVQLFGGCDGLSTVVPFEDDVYARSRPTIRLMPDELLRLNELRGLHPALAGLHRRFQDGRVAIVEGAGYPDPVYSHFRAYEIWHTASARGRAAGDGWIGRLRANAWPADERGELLVHVGGELPYSFACERYPALSFGDPSNLRWFAGDRTLAALSDAARLRPDVQGSGEGARGVLARLRSAMAGADAVAARVQAAMEAHAPRAAYPRDAFARSLRAVAALMNAGFPTRAYSVSLGNFDVHGGTMKNRYWQLLRQLDRALEAFLGDIAGTDAGRRTTVLAFSEFGRRVAENVSGGTDHGAAGPMFLVGEGVRGGLYGAHPTLTDLDGDGNLKYTTDFRRVYASVLRGAFGVEPREVLGADWTPLPVLA